MARRTKYTPETIAKLVEAITAGATYELACGYAGISFETFNEWRKAKPEFSEQLKAAEGLAAVGWLQKIDAAAGQGTWQAAAWKLERRYPQQYGKQVTEIQGKDGGPIEQRHTATSEAVRAAELAYLAALAEPPPVGGHQGDDRPPDQGADAV